MQIKSLWGISFSLRAKVFGAVKSGISSPRMTQNNRAEHARTRININEYAAEEGRKYAPMNVHMNIHI